MSAERASEVIVRLIQFVSSLMVGITLLVGPWTVLWENHPALATSAKLRDVLMAPWFRGAVSGLGLVNLMAAALDIFHVFFRRQPK